METQGTQTTRPQEGQELPVPEKILAKERSRFCSPGQTPK